MSERGIGAGFLVSTVASLGLVAVYVAGGDARLEGVLLGVALGGLGVGFAIWGAALLAGEDETEERESLRSSDQQVDEAEAMLKDEPVTRRKALVRMLMAAGGALASALAIPAFSLGPRPGQSLFRTAWTPGSRLVGIDNQPIRPADLIRDSVTTVFPEGHVRSADAQTVLLKIDEALLPATGERADWSPAGCIGFSKICTHAGCPVGLYRAQSHELLCPCHQSTFDVLRGAEPNFGPADRPLPQLPIAIDEEGFLIARGDFSAPVGPGFWNLTGDEGDV